MSKANALPEIRTLAAKHGFTEEPELFGKLVVFVSAEREERFALYHDEGAFDAAWWAAPTLWRMEVDKRAPGEYGKDGHSLVATAKRRAVGAGEVRPVLVANSSGLELGYMDLKRRIADPNWREKA